MNKILKPDVQEAIEAGWYVALDQGDAVTLRKYKNSHKLLSRPLVTTLRVSEGKVIKDKTKVVGQGAHWAKYAALAAIVLFVLLVIFV